MQPVMTALAHRFVAIVACQRHEDWLLAHWQELSGIPAPDPSSSGTGQHIRPQQSSFTGPTQPSPAHDPRAGDAWLADSVQAVRLEDSAYLPRSSDLGQPSYVSQGFCQPDSQPYSRAPQPYSQAGPGPADAYAPPMPAASHDPYAPHMPAGQSASWAPDQYCPAPVPSNRSPTSPLDLGGSCHSLGFGSARPWFCPDSVDDESAQSAQSWDSSSCV